MRNLKRALSLALASVMLLGMMVVGTSAASYTDVDASDNLEAIEVMQAVGVMTGDGNGFNPDKKVTRNEMAVVMANLLGLDPADYAGTNPFTDVPAWAENYVAACYANKIVSGAGNGLYNGDATVTAAEAALMMQKALGYFQYAVDFGDDWTVATVRQASKIDLFKGIEANAKTALTRNEVAQMGLNALKATMVEPEDNGIGLDAQGNLISKYKYVNITAPAGATWAQKIGTTTTVLGEEIVQLGEKLYDGKLVLSTTSIKDDMDRPANKWDYKTETVGTYADTADYTVVVKKASKTVKDAVESVNSNFTVGSVTSINGDDTTRANSTATQVGDIVEIFMDDTTINTVAKVVITRYSAGKLTADPVTKTTSGVDYVRVPGVIPTYTKTEDIKGYENLKKDDVVYYYVASSGSTDETTYLFKANSVEGKLTTISNSTPTKYTVDGTQYVKNESIAVAALDTPVYNTTYAYYLDNNGYVVYAEEVEAAKSDYVVLQSIAWVNGTGIEGSGYAEARLVKMDGTTEIVKIDSIDGFKAVVSTSTETALKGSNGYSSGAKNTAALANAELDGSLPSVGSSAIGAKYIGFASSAAATTFADKYVGIDGTASNNAVLVEKLMYTYTTTSAGKYKLTTVSGTNLGTSAGSASSDVKASTGKFNGVWVNDDTVFIVEDLNASTPTYTVYTGKNNAPVLYKGSGSVDYVYATNKGVATYIYVFGYDTAATTGDKVYFLSSTYESATEVKKADNSTYTYYTYKAVVGDKVTDVKVMSDATGVGSIAINTLWTPTYNTDGIITALTTVASRAQSLAYGYSLTGTTLVTGKTYGANTYADSFACASDALVIFKDTDGNYTEMTAAEFSADANDMIYVVLTADTADNEAAFLYIVEQDADETGLATYTYNGAEMTKVSGSFSDTIEGVASTKYTKYTNATQAASKALAITAKAGCQITYNTSGWTAANFSAGTDVSNTMTIANVGASDVIYYVRVTAEDTTVSYYMFDIDAA